MSAAAATEAVRRARCRFLSFTWCSISARTGSTSSAWRGQSRGRTLGEGGGVSTPAELEMLEAMFADEFLTTLHAVRDLSLDRLGGRAEHEGDIGLGDPFELMEDDDFTHSVRERGDGPAEQDDLFLLADRFQHTGPIL